MNDGLTPWNAGTAEPLAVRSRRFCCARIEWKIVAFNL